MRIESRRVFAERRLDRRRASAQDSGRWSGEERRSPVGDRRTPLLAVTCPRCGHVDRMTAASYAGWPDGILCGLCGPPPVKMVAITP